MTIANVFDLRTGETVAEGLQSGAVCDDAIRSARSLAARMQRSVVVEDHGTRKCYRVTPAGHIWRVPKGWEVPVWDGEED